MTDGILVDLYSEDVNGHPDLQKLYDAGFPWIGVSVKVNQGLYYSSGAWLNKYWPLARSVAGAAYGKTWFRQGYSYLDLTAAANAMVKQADFCLALIDKAGGRGPGDLPLGIDVEQASNPENPGAQYIIDRVTPFANRILAVTGQKPICYGGSYLRDNHVTDHMGCVAPWVADYSATLPPSVYASIGYPDWKTVFAWQYCGTEGYTGPANYPKVSPCGHTDLSAIIIDGGGENGMSWMRAHVPPENPDNP